MSNTSFLMSNDGVITLVHKARPHTITRDHVNYDAIVVALDTQEFDDLDNLLDVTAIVSRAEGVDVRDGDVYFEGEKVGGVIATRILSMAREGRNISHMVAFLTNLMSNPSKRAVEELYNFLENRGMPITPDGCFIGYKGVSNNYKDIHSGRFDNSVGQVISMPRNKVDDDARQSCSYGFHVGSLEYADNWASSGRVMLVKVNPADAVAVPYEDAEKLRVCKYEVIDEYVQRRREDGTHNHVEGSVYGDEDDELEDEGWDDQNDFEDDSWNV